MMNYDREIQGNAIDIWGMVCKVVISGAKVKIEEDSDSSDKPECYDNIAETTSNITVGKNLINRMLR
jgi:hypothetical protein